MKAHFPRVVPTPVPGLTLVTDVLTPELEEEILRNVNAAEWSTALSRRTLHYGYEYSYVGGPLTATTPLPEWATPVLKAVSATGMMTPCSEAPDQLIVNEYTPGQGIAPHIDNPHQFGPYVLAVSLGSDITMRFGLAGVVEDVVVLRRSAYLMEGDARYRWTHGIDKRKSDKMHSGKRVPRGTRVSLTFRSTKK